jgi:acyl carrier protein
VKIRGLRIELGEIEAHLARHESVKETAVLVHENVLGEKRLVAYLVASDPANPPSVDALREHLKGSLPGYMVPSAFVTLQKMPLTPNGKLNRKALPAPELRACTSRQYEAPHGKVEEILAGIWQRLLGVERVDRQENFFELGGDSLTAMRLPTKIADAFAIHFQVQAVLRNSTFSDMAKFIERLLSEKLSFADPSQEDSEEGVI